jgi:hypothetical protein
MHSNNKYLSKQYAQTPLVDVYGSRLEALESKRHNLQCHRPDSCSLAHRGNFPAGQTFGQWLWSLHRTHHGASGTRCNRGGSLDAGFGLEQMGGRRFRFSAGQHIRTTMGGQLALPNSWEHSGIRNRSFGIHLERYACRVYGWSVE